jgi:hypothetical protein
VSKAKRKTMNIDDVIALWEGFCEEYLADKKLPEEFARIDDVIWNSLEWIHEQDSSVADDIRSLANDIEGLCDSVAEFSIHEPEKK